MADLSLPRSWQLLIDALWYQRWPTTLQDWDVLLRIAETQNLTGTLAFMAPDGLPLDVARRLRAARYEAEARYVRGEAVLRELGALLRASDLSAVLFKGFVVAQVYPYPPARFFGDIDVLLPGDEAQQRFVAVLLEQGYTTQPDIREGESSQHYPKLFPPQRGMGVEVHRRLGREGGFEHPERTAEVWQRAHPCTAFPDFRTLDPVDHYLFLVYHAVRAHVFELGLRSFYDLYRFTLNWDMATWEQTVARARDWNVMSALRLAWGLQCWFEGRAWESMSFARLADPPPPAVVRAAQQVLLQNAQTELNRMWRAKRKPGWRGWLAYLRLTITMDGTLPWYRWPRRMGELAWRLGRSLTRLVLQGDPVLSSYRRLLTWLREE